MNITAAAPIPAPPPEAPKPAPLRLGAAPDRTRCLARHLLERSSPTCPMKNQTAVATAALRRIGRVQTQSDAPTSCSSV
jgi:hypothetical protein